MEGGPLTHGWCGERARASFHRACLTWRDPEHLSSEEYIKYLGTAVILSVEMKHLSEDLIEANPDRLCRP